MTKLARNVTIVSRKFTKKIGFLKKYIFEKFCELNWADQLVMIEGNTRTIRKNFVLEKLSLLENVKK
jgi:hypothetical protein